MRYRTIVGIAVLSANLGTIGCDSVASRDYDIGPIFPASKGKCDKYNGTAEAHGSVFESCMVTKEECERAAADWRKAMSRNVPDAIQFRC
jgi:hypothetical protein